MKSGASSIVWALVGAAVMGALLFAVFRSQTGQTPSQQLALAAQEVELAGQIRVALASAAEAEKSAVLAILYYRRGIDRVCRPGAARPRRRRRRSAPRSPRCCRPAAQQKKMICWRSFPRVFRIPAHRQGAARPGGEEYQPQDFGARVRPRRRRAHGNGRRAGQSARREREVGLGQRQAGDAGGRRRAGRRAADPGLASASYRRGERPEKWTSWSGGWPRTIKRPKKI